MEIFVLDENFNAVEALDDYISFIWTDRYDTTGDFEIYTLANSRLLNLFMSAKYVSCSISDRLMVIESIKIENDVEDGDKLTIKGRSLESILDRRIVWKQTILSGFLEEELERVLNENAINPSDPKRVIPGLMFVPSGDTAISSIVIESQLFGEDLLSVVIAFCQATSLGFKMVMTEDMKLALSLYKGTNRSYNQTENGAVVFSEDYDNLINSNYSYDMTSYKNVALVGGEGEGADQITAVVDPAGLSGIERKETFVDANQVSSNTEEPITIEDYILQLQEKGLNDLISKGPTYAFDCQTDTNIGFILGKDYSLGDIVQIETQYGIQQVCRVTEMIFSVDSNGFTAYPTFTKME